MKKDVFEELANLAPVMIWQSDPGGQFVFFSADWLDFTGHQPERRPQDAWAESVHPEDLPRVQEAYQAAFSTRAELGVEYRLRRGDGTWRWVLDRGRPVVRGHVFEGFAGALTDIHDWKKCESSQAHLLSEMNHRVKNVLATVQALARQSLPGASSAKELERRFSGRLMALSRGQELQAAHGWTGAELGELVRQITGFSSPDPARLHVDGPDLILPSSRAQSMAMALQELCMNAKDHGAWSNESGRVVIRWSVHGSDPPVLEFTWRETGGPTVGEPARRGFGSRLIRSMLPHEADGTSELRFDPSGVVCAISMSFGQAPAHPGEAR